MGLIPVLPLNIEIIIAVLAVAYTVGSIFIQRKLSNPKRMREIQAKVAELQKDMNAMLKAKAGQEELAAKQKEMMPLIGEQMKNSMKPMLIVFPLLIVVYYLLIPRIPLIAQNNVVNSSKELFFIIVFVLGLVAAAIVMIYDRRAGKREKAAREAAAGRANAQ